MEAQLAYAGQDGRDEGELRIEQLSHPGGAAVQPACDRHPVNWRGGVVAEENADRGLKRVLRQAAPAAGVLDRREGADLATVADQQMDGGQPRGREILGRVRLVGFVD